MTTASWRRSGCAAASFCAPTGRWLDACRQQAHQAAGNTSLATRKKPTDP